VRNLLIDDLRTLTPLAGEELRICRSFQEGLDALRSDGPWDNLYLDHDLGDENPAHTGYDILCWLEENIKYLPGSISLLTDNPVGRQKMRTVLRQFTERYGIVTEFHFMDPRWGKI